MLAHRGMWNIPSEKNQSIAFARAFENGFGCELDIRDKEGQLVISHDVPQGKCLTLEEVIESYQKYNSSATIAINVKADGLQKLLEEVLEKYEITNYFVFDMSIPDTLGYIERNLKTFARQSEYEPQPALYEKVEGIWLDSFLSEWWTETELKQHLSQGKKIALVSPELHKRQHQEVWLKWREILATIPEYRQQISLCTDLPQQAKEFFHA